MIIDDDRNGTSEFEQFANSGEVEGSLGAVVTPTPEPEKKPRRGPPKEAPVVEKPADQGKPDDDDQGDDDNEPGEEDDDASKVNDEGDDEGDDDGEPEEDDEKPEKKKNKPSDRIRELTRRLRERDRLLDTLASEVEALKKGGLPSPPDGGNSAAEAIPAPDPTDTEKYPLGHLDDRYIEDKLEWLAEDKAAKRADAVLHRQQEDERIQAAETMRKELLGKVDDLAARGSDIDEDFDEIVVKSGLRGDWDLSQTTFEAAHEAEHGAQILYELARDKKEATRVAQLSHLQQLKYVAERDAEIAKTKTPRRKPQAGDPPKNLPRGASSRSAINPATDDLALFEKQWEREAKANS